MQAKIYVRLWVVGLLFCTTAKLTSSLPSSGIPVGLNHCNELSYRGREISTKPFLCIPQNNLKRIDNLANIRGGGTKCEKEEAPRISMFYPMFVAWTYTMSVALAIPSLPRLVNMVVNGVPDVTPRSQMAYSALLALDNSFTVFTSNMWCTLSDKYGRRPFMAMAALGIGTGALLVASSNAIYIFCLAATIDGLTSCMHGLCQAVLCDITKASEMPKRFAAFLGMAIGMAFMVGIPISVVLSTKVGPRAPFFVSSALAFTNFLFIVFICPETVSSSRRREQISLRHANPLGALHTLAANWLVAGIGFAYLILQLAHMGLQVPGPAQTFF
jgi:MFS transporter, DHA1 family, tetracycline resistance protein